MGLGLEKLKFIRLTSFMDGGSLLLEFVNDESNSTVKIEIVQHGFLHYYEEISKIPGRIYLNEKLISKRSKEEDCIMEFLKFFLLKTLNETDKKFLIEKLNFIESAEYMELEPKVLELSSKRKKDIQSMKNKK